MTISSFLIQILGNIIGYSIALFIINKIERRKLKKAMEQMEEFRKGCKNERDI